MLSDLKTTFISLFIPMTETKLTGQTFGISLILCLWTRLQFSDSRNKKKINLKELETGNLSSGLGSGNKNKINHEDIEWRRILWIMWISDKHCVGYCSRTENCVHVRSFCVPKSDSTTKIFFFPFSDICILQCINH